MRPAAIPVVAGLLLSPLLMTGCGQGGNESTLTLTGTAPPTPIDSGDPIAPGASDSPTDTSAPDPSGPEVVATIATGLQAPWGLDFFANGDAIVTERDSRRVLRISPDGDVREIGLIDAAAPEGEGGLLGVALSPDFAQDSLVYLYVTTATDNRIVRAALTGGSLGEPEVLLDGIPNAFIHDGGRLEFGPDGHLYASTGESGVPELAQDRDSLGGKILRITTDGDPAPGNRFGTPVWSWGHRNVQGLAFDDAGRLWASEFGQDTFDELNLIEKGNNYGWPAVEGTGGAPDYTDPQQTWDVAEASPSGLAYADGSLWMASLRGERLWRISVRRGQAVDQMPYFVGEYGRMRTVAFAPDGTLWLMTSNDDGRGTPGPDDDQILQIQP